MYFAIITRKNICNIIFFVKIKSVRKSCKKIKDSFLGDILMKCNYQKVFGKLRSNPEEYRWLVTYQFEMKNIAIKAEDNFNIISPTNLFSFTPTP